MHTLAKLTWVELKLFARDPITMVFTFAFPLIVLFVLGQAFGNTPDPEGEVFRGVGPMNYYVPAYLGLIALPVHLAAYRERGVLRRLRASSVPVWSMFGSHVIISFVIAILGGILLTIVAMPVYDVHFPKSAGLLVAAFVVSTMSFAALGILLGAVLPTARAAQGVGLLLFFLMMLISGAGPPPEVMGRILEWVGEITPLKHVIVLLQDPWLGFGWNWTEFLIVTGVMVVAAVVSVRVFRWE